LEQHTTLYLGIYLKTSEFYCLNGGELAQKERKVE